MRPSSAPSSVRTRCGTTELADCIKEAQRDGAIDKKQNPQALATTLLAFMRGQEALHKGGAKPAQLKAAAERDDRADSHRPYSPE